MVATMGSVNSRNSWLTMSIMCKQMSLRFAAVGYNSSRGVELGRRSGHTIKGRNFISLRTEQISIHTSRKGLRSTSAGIEMYGLLLRGLLGSKVAVPEIGFLMSAMMCCNDRSTISLDFWICL